MDHVTLYEVGPRDGLQNEAQPLPIAIKKELIHHLLQAGLPRIEVGAFVSPKKVPQMADSLILCQNLDYHADVEYSALVPNLHGLQDCLTTPVRTIGLLTAASETFCQNNLDCSIEESLDRIAELLPAAKKEHCTVRAYISCVLGCPYEGRVSVSTVTRIARTLMKLGCDEISLGDTIGIGTPYAAQNLIRSVSEEISIDKIAVHFHDTFGQALANIFACLELGVRTIDASIAGLGGCPYAKGATGNVATEDVVYLLHGMGLSTGIDLNQLCATSEWISKLLGRPPQSKVARALRRE